MRLLVTWLICASAAAAQQTVGGGIAQPVSASQLPSNVPTSVTNDTNVTGSIASGILTLGWQNALAAARLNSNVVQAIANDTNVTGSISAQTLTLGWSGALGIARGGTGATTASAALTALGGASLTAANAFTNGTGNTFTSSGGFTTVNFDTTYSGGSAPVGFYWTNSGSGVWQMASNMGSGGSKRWYLYDIIGARTVLNAASNGVLSLMMNGGNVGVNYLGTAANALQVNGSISTIALATPGAPTVTPTGTAGSTSYSYVIVAKQNDGSYTAAGAAGSTTTGNATLDTNNYNALTWSAVTNAASYDVYRTVGGGSTGWIANVTANAFNDQGSAGNSAAAPTTATSGNLTVSTQQWKNAAGAQVAGIDKYGIFYPSGIQSSGNIGTTGIINSYNGVSTVANGVPALVAKADAVAQSANIGTTTLYAVPAGGAGMYRLSCFVQLTQVATTSSTLPNCNISWTDADSSNTESAWTGSANGTANNLTTNSTSIAYGGSAALLNAKASTNISYSTVNYASSGATPMLYSIHIKLEFLGN